MDNKIILYSTGCPQCKVLAGLLDKKGIQYEYCSDVNHMMQIGISSVPMLEIDGEILNFQKAMAWVKEATHEN